LLVVVPAWLTKVPGWQFVQLVQAAALALLLKLLAPHAVQARSVVALPAFDANWPATQFVFATQAVLALLSLSHVLPPQATNAVVPPAQ
jgi:hypothetical protein